MSRADRPSFGRLTWLLAGVLATVGAQWLYRTLEPRLQAVLDRRAQIAALSSADAQERHSAFSRLVLTDEATALGPLLGVVDDPRPEVRKQVVGWLVQGRFPAEDVLPALLKAAADDDDRVRSEAASGLGRLPIWRRAGPVPDAERALRDRARPGLDRLLRDPVEAVRLRAIEAHRGFDPDDGLVEAVRLAAADEAWPVRLAVARSMSEAALPCESKVIVDLLPEILGWGQWERMSVAVRLLARVDAADRPAAVAALIRLLDDPDAPGRAEAIACLEILGPEAIAEARPALRRRLDDENPDLSVRAALALARGGGDPDAEAILRTVATSDAQFRLPHWRMQGSVGGNWGDLRDEVISFLLESRPDVVRSVINALVRRLDDPDYGIRYSAWIRLGPIIEQGPISADSGSP